MLKIFNSQTKQKETFTPIEPGKIGMYVCGITVYDYCHLGHARTNVCFDVIVRYLRYLGYAVKFVRNITDIDDKIIKRAAENKEPVEALTARFIAAMHEDFNLLGLLSPDHEPRATEVIGPIIDLAKTLIDKKYAYVADNNDVYFNVDAFDDYGKLAHKDLAGQTAGHRVEIEHTKHNPLDFVLWKSAKPGEPQWDSPWGPGRPGWHIECSAMSMQSLGDNFDIHGGGFDLQFPHHENEIAQSECASGKPYANTWMHVGFLQINEEKMSKSLNNFFTIRDVLKSYDAETVRYFLLSSQYRSQLNYAEDNLKQANAALQRFYQSLRGVTMGAVPKGHEFEQRFANAMNDDFNTPEALAVLFDLSHAINREKDANPSLAGELGALLQYLGGVLGIMQQSPQAYLQGDMSQIDVDKIESLIAKRNDARENKVWAEADRVRDELKAMGIELEDKSGKTRWRVVGK